MSLRCRHVRKVFPTRNGAIVAIDEATFDAGSHEFVCIVGPSGCGKSTLLKLIAGLAAPSSGEIAFDGTASVRTGRPGEENGPHCALVFQEHGLFPWKSVLDNVAFGLNTVGGRRDERRDKALAFIEQVGLGRFARNYPHELSVGMRQRANIARAFVSEPQVLLMDEPFGALDAQTRLLLQEDLLRIWNPPGGGAERRKLVLYVTHDVREAAVLGDRVLVMSGHPGRIRAEFPVALERPRDLSDVDHPEVGRVAREVWGILKEEVHRALWLAQ